MERPSTPSIDSVILKLAERDTLRGEVAKLRESTKNLDGIENFSDTALTRLIQRMEHELEKVRQMMFTRAEARRSLS